MPIVARMEGAFEAGTVLRGTYEIVRLVGWGGMGEVYEARHARLPGRFAVKRLTARVTAESSEFLRFRREAEIASSLQHPNIIRVFDFDQTEQGTPFLVMEFLVGRDLGAELELVKRLPPSRAADIVSQVASALNATHGRGIVHRDLKPQNVFLSPIAGEERELVKILDFGISKAHSAASVTTETRIVGTPQYMSPEQARSSSGEQDARTDQFALAAIAYEMLTGRCAFSGDSVPAILLKVTTEEPAPVASIVPELPPAIDAVLRRALSKSPRMRFDSVLAFAEAFAAAARGDRADTVHAPGRWLGSHSLRTAGILAVALGVFVWWRAPGSNNDHGKPAAPRAVPPTVRAAVVPATPSTVVPAAPLQQPAAKPDVAVRKPLTDPRPGMAAAPRVERGRAAAQAPAESRRKVFIDNLSGETTARSAAPLPIHHGTFVDGI